MLFSVKNRFGPTLLLLLSLAGGSFLTRAALRIPWRLAPYPGLARDAAFGLAAVLVSDGLVHGCLWLLYRDRYLARFRALAQHFRPQGIREIVASGMLAGGEELFFRGVLLTGLANGVGAGAGAGLAVSALVFGALHVLRDPGLAPFALWAVWEGVLLGAVYLAFGSLLTSVLVHAAHDILGFGLFAMVRRQGRLMRDGASE
jgi:membrane protease YdiL (CAAX protease family)